MKEMRRRITSLLLVLLMGITWTSDLRAQGVNQEEQKHKPMETKTAIQIIVLSGLGGAVLGLSTLSFYTNPQDELRNIAIGAACAVVIATLYVTFQTAQGKPPKLELDEDATRKAVHAPEMRHTNEWANATPQGATWGVNVVDVHF
jgi:NhaP-type Na+/H+ or K+/H+ antiporter